jgi:hypothetical protein
MKVKIIANQPLLDKCSDITPYIGQEFEAYIASDGVYIKLNERTDMLVFAGEYEVLEP